MRSARRGRSSSTSAGVHLPEPIRNIGTYMIVVELPGGLTANVKTMIVAQGD